MRKTVRRTRRKAELIVKIYAPVEIGAELAAEISRGMIERNRRRERAGGERMGYRVEVISSSSS